METPEKESLGGVAKVKPWSPGKATKTINAYAVSPELGIAYKIHAKEQMGKRDLYMSDVLHVLRTGYVYDDPQPATQIGLYRYAIEGKTPNSAGRIVRVILIPSSCRAEVKIITVMWKDE